MQAVTTAFSSESVATRRNLSYYCRISWTRSYDPNVTFAVVGTSVVGGTDIIKGDSDEYITESDKFYFDNETEYAISLEYERSIEEPNGGILVALADIVLDNTSKRFTYGYDGTIGLYIKPQRVVKIGVGFNETILPVFKGVATEVEETRAKRELHLHCQDYLNTFATYKMDSVIFNNLRSDEVIEKILIDIGFNETQYQLDCGLNTIEFAWFNSENNVADVIKEICEAEEAIFYQDENGILRFENREHYSYGPHLGTQFYLDADDIIEMEYDYNKVYNKCKVTATPREVLDSEVIVWENDWQEIGPGESVTFTASFSYTNEDETSESVPCASLVTPVEGTDYISVDISENSMAEFVELVSIEKYAESATLVFRNTHASKTAYLSTLQLRGVPAIKKATIEESYEDATSIAIYGEKLLPIDNNYIDNATYAQEMAKKVVQKYSNPLQRLKVTIRGIPQLQLRDTISITDPDTSVAKLYRLMAISGSITVNDGFIQTLTLREVLDIETEVSPHRIISAKARIVK